MILGFILICGMGAEQPNAINGCDITTRLFSSNELCQNSIRLFDYSALMPGYYVEDSDCFVIGTKT
jgi:hypothetical protein